MLPFPIMNQYGNTVQAPELQLATSGTSVYILNKSTNNLYGASNYGYMVGSANTDNSWAGTTFRLMRNDIKKIFSNNGTSLVTYMLTTDNRVLALGNKLYFSGVTSMYSPYEDITSTLTSAGIDCSLIVHMECWYGTKISILLSNGNVYCVGSNTLVSSGCYGNGSTSTVYNTPVLTATNMKKVTGNLWLDNNGNLYSAGDNSKYQYGNGTTTSSWVRVLIDHDVKDISAGYWSNYYLKNDGRMFCTGSAVLPNDSSELGLGSTIKVAQVPTQCGTNILSIGVLVGNVRTYQLRTDGWYSTGYNTDQGIGGAGNTLKTFSYVPMVGTFGSSGLMQTTVSSVFLLDNNKLYVCGTKLGAGATNATIGSNVLTEIIFQFS